MWTNKSYPLFAAHAAYKCVSFLYVFLFLPGVELHQLMIHGIIAGPPIMHVTWYYLIFKKHAALNATITEKTLTVAIVEGT